jgi:hypothetical protein
MAEKWECIEGFPDYQISNLGRIKSFKQCRGVNEKILKSLHSKYGYLQICFCTKGKIKKFYIHRLMLQTFKPILNSELYQCNHIDGNKRNNDIDNLEWCTPSENNQHAYNTGLHKIKKGVDSPIFNRRHSMQSKEKMSLKRRGIGAALHKLSEEEVKEIKILLSANELTQRKIAEMYDVHFNTISMIKLGVTWSHIHNE